MFPSFHAPRDGGSETLPAGPGTNRTKQRRGAASDVKAIVVLSVLSFVGVLALLAALARLLAPDFLAAGTNARSNHRAPARQIVHSARLSVAAGSARPRW